MTSKTLRRFSNVLLGLTVAEVVSVFGLYTAAIWSSSHRDELASTASLLIFAVIISGGAWGATQGESEVLAGRESREGERA